MYVSMQLMRVGSVYVKSLKETSSLVAKQPRPVELIFHRRSNGLRHMLRRIVVANSDMKTWFGSAKYPQHVRDTMLCPFSVVKL